MKIIQIAQIIIALILTTLVLFQQRGGGLSQVFGGSEQFYGTRRGLEKTIFILTIIFGAIFIGLGVAALLWH